MSFVDKPIPKRKYKSKAKVVPKIPLPKNSPIGDANKEGVFNGDIEHDDNAEATVIKKFMRKVDEEAKRMMGNGYWTTLVFPDEATCNKFLELTGWDKHAEGRNAYVDGLAVAELLGIKLNVEPIRFKGAREDTKLIAEIGVFDSKAYTAAKVSKARAKALLSVDDEENGDAEEPDEES